MLKLNAWTRFHHTFLPFTCTFWYCIASLFRLKGRAGLNNVFRALKTSTEPNKMPAW